MLRLEVFTHKRLFRSSDGQGGWVGKYEKVGVVRMRGGLAALTFRDRESADVRLANQRRGKISYIGYIPKAYDVVKSDVFVDRVGVEYVVTSVRKAGRRNTELQMRVWQKGR